MIKTIMLSSKSILLTGCTGFIGISVVEALVKEGFSPILLVRKKSNADRLGSIKEKITFIEVDFDNPQTLEEALAFLKGQNISAVFYALGAIKAHSRADYNRVNIEYLQTFYEVVKKHAILYERFVFISSLTPYGPLDDTSKIISHNSPLRPLTYYAESKILAEKFIVKEVRDYIIVRPAAVYGKYDKETLPLFKIINKLGIYIAFSSKNNIVGFVHITDLSDHIVHLIKQGDKNTDVFSCTHNVSVKEYSHKVAKKLHKKILFAIILPTWLLWLMASFNELFFKIVYQKIPMLSVQKVKELTGKCWACSKDDFLQFSKGVVVDLDQRIGETVDWYKENGWM